MAREILVDCLQRIPSFMFAFKRLGGSEVIEAPEREPENYVPLDTPRPTGLMSQDDRERLFWREVKTNWLKTIRSLTGDEERLEAMPKASQPDTVATRLLPYQLQVSVSALLLLGSKLTKL